MLQVQFDEVIGEPEGAHSADCVWVWSFKCFTGEKSSVSRMKYESDVVERIWRESRKGEGMRRRRERRWMRKESIRAGQRMRNERKEGGFKEKGEKGVRMEREGGERKEDGWRRGERREDGRSERETGGKMEGEGEKGCRMEGEGEKGGNG